MRALATSVALAAVLTGGCAVVHDPGGQTTLVMGIEASPIASQLGPS